ncbi:unnamed protein product [Cunninghamella echinulata]
MEMVNRGSLASRYAPVSKRTTMDCDDNDHTNQHYIKDTEMKDGNKINTKWWKYKETACFTRSQQN